MKRFYFILSLIGGIFFQSLIAEEPFLMIDSADADYNGKEITLTGNVIVEHEFGKISANRMVLTPNENHKKLSLAFLKMDDQVKIQLKDGGQLSCSSAQLNYQNFSGEFSGDHQQEFVVYTEDSLDKAGQLIPLIVKSRQMHIKMIEEKNQDQSLVNYISHVQAHDNVTLNYNEDIIAAADHAIYERVNLRDSSLDIKGRILLQADQPNGICQVTNRNGDLIKSEQISIDTLLRHIHFEYPQGAIYTKGENEKDNRIDFISDTMLWDDPNDTLILNKNIVVNQQGMGQLNNQEEVRLYRQFSDGRKRLQKIDSLGETTLHYIDENQNKIHTIICHGKVSIDHEHLQAFLESPRDEYGNVLKDKQIYFEDRLGEIYADQAFISYDYINHQIVPAKITLKGHVYLQNRTAADAEDPGQFLQYAIADIVEFYPIKKKMYFRSEGNHRVLFFDKPNNIQMSSTALKIYRDPQSKKESIQGLGDVRMSFIEEELDKLRKQFNLQRDNLK